MMRLGLLCDSTVASDDLNYIEMLQSNLGGRIEAILVLKQSWSEFLSSDVQLIDLLVVVVGGEKDHYFCHMVDRSDAFNFFSVYRVSLMLH